MHNALLSQVSHKQKAACLNQAYATGFINMAKITVEPSDTPSYFKARAVPYTYREKVEKELA